MTKDLLPPSVAEETALTERNGKPRAYGKNRDALDKYLDTGAIPKKGQFAQALLELTKAVLDGEVWAVKLTIEYAVGRPEQVSRDRQADEAGDGDFNFSETQTRIREIRETTRRATLPRSDPR